MTALAVSVRRAHPGDGEAIASAHVDSICSIGPAFYPRDAVAAWCAGLIPDMYVKAMKGGEAFFIAEGRIHGEAAVLGFSTHRVDDDQHGVSVYVRGMSARQGIGTALLRIAEENARVHGAAGVRIQASLAGIDFYKANGFEEIGRGAVVLSGGSIPCAYMWKQLTSG